MSAGRMKGMSLFASLAVGMAGLASPVAHAEPDVFDVTVTTVGGFMEVANFPGYVFGTSQSVEPFPGFPIAITSGAAVNSGWHYQMLVDYTGYQISDFGIGTSTVAMSGIKGPDSPFPINAASAVDSFGNTIGNLSFDSGSIIWVGSNTDIDSTGNLITIQWTQVPTPGALAMFGLAGLVASHRRRHR